MRNRYLARSLPGSLAHLRCAFVAASTAAATSALPASATFVSVSSVAGLITFMNLPDFGFTKAPPMNSPCSAAISGRKLSGAGA